MFPTILCIQCHFYLISAGFSKTCEGEGLVWGLLKSSFYMCFISFYLEKIQIFITLNNLYFVFSCLNSLIFIWSRLHHTHSVYRNIEVLGINFPCLPRSNQPRMSISLPKHTVCCSRRCLVRTGLNRWIHEMCSLSILY